MSQVLGEDAIDFDRIVRETHERDKSRPLARAARYEAATQQLVIELRNGATLSIPARLLQGVSQASDEQRAAFYVTDSGAGLHWDALDVQLSVEGLAQGRFGTRAWMEQVNAEAAPALPHRACAREVFVPQPEARPKPRLGPSAALLASPQVLAADQPAKFSAMSTAVLSSDFQIEIPLEVRQSLGLQPGQEVHFIEYEGRVQLVHVPPIEEAMGMFPGIDTTIEREPDREL